MKLMHLFHGLKICQKLFNGIARILQRLELKNVSPLLILQIIFHSKTGKIEIQKGERCGIYEDRSTPFTGQFCF